MRRALVLLQARRQLLAPAAAGSSSAGAGGPTLPPGLVALERKTTAELRSRACCCQHRSLRPPRRAPAGAALAARREHRDGRDIAVAVRRVVSLQLAGEASKCACSPTASLCTPGTAARVAGARGEIRRGPPGSAAGGAKRHRAATPAGSGTIVPGLAKPPFAQLQRTLAGAREVRELPREHRRADRQGSTGSWARAVQEGALLAGPTRLRTQADPTHGRDRQPSAQLSRTQAVLEHDHGVSLTQTACRCGRSCPSTKPACR
jgi:hypothetical protein